jgi:phosphatidylglycerol:prolipoprotein diacylglycerol transferase
MLPFLHVGSFAVPTFGLMLWVASATAALVVDRAFRRAHITADAVWMVSIAVIAGIVGSRLWEVFVDRPAGYGSIGWGELWGNAGFSWYGGLIFGIAAMALQGWRAKIGALRTLDLVCPATAIGNGLGRIGCFLSGDGCYGVATRPLHLLGFTFQPWGISFPHGIEPILVPVYPTPLYELATGLAIGWWLWWRLGKPHATGAIAGQFLVLTGTARFLVEFIRRNPKVLWGLTSEQLAAAGAVAAGVALLWWVLRGVALAPVKTSGREARVRP